MAIEWKTVTSGGYGEIGVDWNTSVTATAVTYAPIVYIRAKYHSSDPSMPHEYLLTVNGNTVVSGSITLSYDTPSGSQATQIDTYASRTVNKTTSSQTISLKLKFSDGYIYNDSKINGTWTWTYTVPALASYTISYNANGGSGAPSSQIKYYGTNLTLSSTKPSKSGYTFVGWNTSNTATTSQYPAGGTYTANASATLYAIWQKTITLTYNANGGSGAPSSQSATVYNSTTSYTFTLSSTKPSKSGYTFVGWNTSNTATTSQYSAGGSITLSSSTTLYAVWQKTITLTYNANGGSNAPSSQSATIYNSATSYTFTLSNSKPTRTGYAFLGWSTSNTATSSSYSAGGSITLSSSNTLYAVWSEYKLTVNYYSNYATESFSEALNTVGADKNVIVRTAYFYYSTNYSNGHWDYSYSGASTYLGRTGYTATGNWGTSTSGGTLVSQSTSYSSGQALAEAVGKSLNTGNASINLYAQWQINTYTIVYNANGGSNSMNSQTVKWNEKFQFLSNAFSREGYKFIGWNLYRNDDNKWYTSPNGWSTENEIVANGYSKRLYENQSELTFDNSWISGNESARLFTLYAIWKISGVVYIENGTTFEPYLAYIDNGTSWDLYLAYIDNGTSWNIIS